MNANSSPRLRYTAYALCLICCIAKIVAVVMGGSFAASFIANVDFRLPLIAAGWTCIGLASFLMLRANRELAAPAVCRARKTTD